MSVDTDKKKNKDEYPIRITATLDNLYNWFDSDDKYFEDYVNDPNHQTRLYDPDYPPSWLLYTK